MPNKAAMVLACGAALLLAGAAWLILRGPGTSGMVAQISGTLGQDDEASLLRVVSSEARDAAESLPPERRREFLLMQRARVWIDAGLSDVQREDVLRRASASMERLEAGSSRMVAPPDTDALVWVGLLLRAHARTPSDAAVLGALEEARDAFVRSRPQRGNDPAMDAMLLTMHWAQSGQADPTSWTGSARAFRDKLSGTPEVTTLFDQYRALHLQQVAEGVPGAGGAR